MGKGARQDNELLDELRDDNTHEVAACCTHDCSAKS